MLRKFHSYGKAPVGEAMACDWQWKGMELFNRKNLDTIGKKLLKKKQTIAVAESVTSGLLQLALSSITDASLFYHGGITAYNLAQKFKHLQIEPIHAKSVNCVSAKVAEQMAIGICTLYSSDWGVGITGYASPVPESGQKVFAYYAIAYKGKIKSKGKISAAKDEAMSLQVKYADTVIGKLNKCV